MTDRTQANNSTPSGSTPDPVVIFIASSTPEKVRDFQLIAEEKHLPIIFEDIHKLVSAFHYADETKSDFSGNAGEKILSLKLDEALRQKLKDRAKVYCEQRGIPTTSRVFIASEDSGYRLPKAVWDKINKDGIPHETLARINHGADPNFTGPGVETAPVLSAVLGDYQLMRRVHKAATELGLVQNDIPIPVMQNSVLSLAPLDEKDTTGKIFSAEMPNMVHFPKHDEVKNKLKYGKVSGYDYTIINDGMDKTHGQMGKDAIVGYSVRSKIAGNIFEHLFDRGVKPDFDHSFRSKIHPRTFKVGAFGVPNSVDLSQQAEQILAGNKLGASFSKAGSDYVGGKSSYDVLANIEAVMAGSDSAILVPDMLDKTGRMQDPEQARLAEIMKLYTLSSLVVNKQLNARDADKPIIILNHDGSWNKAIAVHNSLANLSMTKEHAVTVPRTFDNPKNIDYKTNGYFEVVGTPNGAQHSYEDTIQTALNLLSEARKGYIAGHPVESPEFENGDAPNHFKGFKVAIFCSAGSENYYLNQGVKQLSHDLAAHEFGIVYGAGDRHTMGAVLDGVNQYRSEMVQHQHISSNDAKKLGYIAGYSTKQLLKSETKISGFSPDLNYAKQDKDIYQRMSDMLDNSDVLVAAPGGAGTVQEWTAALLLNQFVYPEQHKPKIPIVFYNPKLNDGAGMKGVQVWNDTLKAVLGEEDYKLLTSTDKKSENKREKRSAELGIYVENTEAAVEHRVEKIRSQKQAEHIAPRSGFAERIASEDRPAAARLH